MIEFVATNGIAVLGVLALLVTVVVELTKNVGFLKKVPTEAYVIVLSIVLTMVGYAAIIGFLALPLVWYELVGAFFASFIVAYVSMYGWEKLTGLWSRFYDRQ